MGRNVRAAQVGDQDLCLLGVSLLNVLEGFLARDGGAAVASQRTPVGQRLQEPRDVLKEPVLRIRIRTRIRLF